MVVEVKASSNKCVDDPPKSLRKLFFNWFVFKPQTSASAMMIILFSVTVSHSIILKNIFIKNKLIKTYI